MDGLLSNKQVSGHKILLNRTDPRHIAGSGARKSGADPSEEGTSGGHDERAFPVNDLQQESLKLSQQMITDPDSGDAHDVTITLAEANMALNITKTVVDRVIRAYREIISASERFGQYERRIDRIDCFRVEGEGGHERIFQEAARPGRPRSGRNGRWSSA
jgi:flagellar hook-basal body complex protein FliE